MSKSEEYNIYINEVEIKQKKENGEKNEKYRF